MEYKTIRNKASDEFVVKRSRFIGHIAPVATVEEATEFINSVKSEHWNATHNVFAYSLREGQLRRYSDDGEPQGTAGLPVLDVLMKEEVVDCAVVVTRYFGGVMLGAGGLVRAYSHASKIALDAGEKVTRALCDILKVNCDYSFYGRLSSLIPESGGIVESTDFQENVSVSFYLPDNLTKGFNEKLIDLSLGKFRAEKTGERFADICVTK